MKLFYLVTILLTIDVETEKIPSNLEINYIGSMLQTEIIRYVSTPYF